MLALQLLNIALLAQAPVQQEAAAPVSNEHAIAAIDAAIARGATWLRARQQNDGSFAPVTSEAICPVAMTAMALWSLSESLPQSLDDQQVRNGVTFLVAHHQSDGGIYDPARGLAVYTTGVTVRALRSLGTRVEDKTVPALLNNAELFVYRRATPESILDAVAQGDVSVAKSSQTAQALLDHGGKIPEDKRKALEFLAGAKRDAVRTPARLRAPGARAAQAGAAAFGYDDLLPFVYLDLSPDHTVALRALDALRSYYTADRNPDLTKRYGPAGFQPGTQGLFYYYLLVARALSTHSVAVITTADGAKHDWPREISARLMQLQGSDGSWVNEDTRWWEHEPVLVTSYALLTLARCRATLAGTAAAAPAGR